MKKAIAFLLAAVLAVASFSAYLTVTASAEAAEDSRSETFPLTAKNVKAPEAADDGEQAWYADGVVVAVANDSDTEMTISSGDYALRYLFILVFDGSGVCVEIGNNLFAADDALADEHPQHDITIPAGGFAILFYYNTSAPANQALFEYYCDLGGADIYNMTIEVDTDYSAKLENDTVTVRFGKLHPTPEYGLNVARGAQYITSDLFRQNGSYQWSADAPISYPDTDGVELTDGVFPTGEDGYSDPAYFGFRADSPDYVKRGYAYIRVDLGQVYDLSALVLYVGTSNLSNGIFAPEVVSFYAVGDMDGSDPVLLGSVSPEDDDTVPYVPCVLETEVSVQFVEIRVNAFNWLFVTEFEAYAPGLTLGDLDGNGVINSFDYMMVKRYVLQTSRLTAAQKIVADVDRDGDITALDYMFLKRHVLGTFVIG